MELNLITIPQSFWKILFSYDLNSVNKINFRKDIKCLRVTTNLTGGYAGEILRIDLSKRKIHQWRADESLLRKFIGGSGLAAKILFDETGPSVDPFDPENLLIFMTGPVTATRVPLSGRYQVVSKSPLTGIYGESDSGGSWGPELKKTGFDGIVISGRASKPVYLWISDGHAELKDADHLWGMDTYETDQAVKDETDE
ncbi:hypothetical protein DRO38_05180, partial [Candidatus Bathyarchaeota archaeon]